MIWPKCLETNAARMRAAIPILCRNFGRLNSFALDNCHLPPCAIQPNVPGNMTRGTAQAAVPFYCVKTVIERIIDLAFNQAAANPKTGRTACEGTRVNPSRDLLRLKSVLPRLAGVGDNQF